MSIIGNAWEVASRKLDSGEDMNRKFTRTYMVRSDSPVESELVVRDAPGIPLPFSVFPTDLGCLVTSRVPSQIADNPYLWTVEVTWSALSLTSRAANAARSDPAQRNENPLARPPRLSFDTEDYQEPFDRDLNGVPIRNTANDLFDPPLTRDAARPTFTISRNFISPDLSNWERFHNTVNSDYFLIWAPGVVKCKKISIQSQFEDNKYFYEKTATFQIAKKIKINGTVYQDWKFRPLNNGFQELVDGFFDGKVKQSIVMADGTKPTVPQLLNDDGGLLPLGSDPIYAGPFECYDEANFYELGFL